MSAKTGIQWTDATWNPVVGCGQVSPGCAHCYAKTLHDMRHRAYHAGKQMAPQYAQPFETVQLKPERLTAPLSWRKPRRVFVNSVADLFHDDVPTWFIDRVFAVMAGSQRHTYQVLTKRPARMLAYMSTPDLSRRIAETLDRLCDDKRVFQAYQRDTDVVLWGDTGATAPGSRVYKMSNIQPEAWPLPNVWLGVSVENQRFADERIPLLLRTPAAVRFLSCEPLLGPVYLRPYVTTLADVLCCPSCGFRTNRFSRCPNDDRELTRDIAIDWVIVGGESGEKARPLDVRWVADVVAHCKTAGVATFVKQLGAVPMEPEEDWRGRATTRVLNAKNHDRVPAGYVPLLMRDRHGADMAEWPEELRVREFPASEGRS